MAFESQDVFFHRLTSTPADNVLVYLDYDDCLDISTRRVLTDHQKQILWNLHDYTNGGLIITTNSDGRTVMDVLPGFPCISEFATVIRNVGETNTEYTSKAPNCKAAYTFSASLLSQNFITLTHSATDLNGSIPMIKLEQKEMGLALVFGKHAHLKNTAKAVAREVFSHTELGFNHSEVEVGKDAVEIKSKGGKKSNVIDLIQKYPHLANRQIQIAIGDSGSDREVMERTKLGIIVGDAVKDSTMSSDINYTRIEIKNADFTPTWEFLKRLRNHYATAKPALTKYPSPAVL